MADTVSDLSLSDPIAPKANPFADAVAGVLKQEGQDTAAQIRSNVQFAVGTNPDQEAGFKHLASYVGVPVDTVRAQPEAIKQQAAMQSMDAGKIVSDFPHLAKFLTDPNNTRIIHDDIPGTASVEQATKALTPPLDDYPSMTEWNPSLGQRARMWLDKLFTPGVNALIGNAPEPQKQFVSGLLNTGSFGIVPDVAGEATTGAGAIGKGAGSLTGFVLGGPIKAADYLAGKVGITALEHVAGESFAKALAKDITVGAAKLGTASALAHVGTGIDSPDVATFLAQEGKAAGSGAAMGGIFGAAGRLLPDSTIAQTLGRVVGVNAALDASQGKTPFEDLANWDKLTGAQQADAVFNYGLNTLFSLRGAGRTTGGWWNDAAKADIANEDMTKLQQLGQVAAASKLRERDPAAFKQFIENVTEDGHLSEVYIDARALGDVLNQAGVTPDKFVEQMPEVAAQMHEALQTGGDVRISVADYATHVAGGPVDAGILPHLKTDPDGKTYAQAQEFYQGQRAQLQEEAGKIIAQRAEDEAFKADHQQVFDQVFGQLNDANRFTPDVNKAYATLARDFYVTTADKLGVKPTELLDRYPLKVAVERMTEDGKHFDQASRVDQQLDQWARGELPGGHIVEIGQPSQLLRSFGMDDLPIHLTTSVLRKTVEKHQVSAEDLKGLAKAIQSPLAVFASKKGDGHLVVLTELKHDTGNIIAALDLNATRREIQIHDIRSVHPKDTDSVFNWIKDGLLLGYEKTKGREWLDGNSGSDSRRDQVNAALTSARIYESGGEYNQAAYNENHGFLPDDTPADRPLDAAALADLRSQAAGLERPEAGVMLRITDDGHAIATGPKGTRIPETFVRFAEENNLKFMARRKLPTATTALNPIADYSEPMPIRYRAGGSLYFNEMGDAWLDRTGMSLFQGNRGAYNPETGTIALLKGADLSTFLHETGHHFLEMTADLASRADAPEAIRADFGKLLDWFGVKDAAEWHNLSFEEKRSYHEQFARGFEAYLLEGKAPSVELAGLFSRFRSWLLNVYKSITGLGVELTPEVRGVFDRMLASEDAIKNAEQVRGYEPMFKSATDAGMTPEQWADYQKLGAEATENAIDDMEKRSLRDMRWLSNAKAGALKDLQREAASKRREVRTEVSKEVWSQPVYQAWQFLTSKENLEPVKAAPKAKASKGVDEGRDSLLTAIAKLGGIERDKASVDLGIHKDDYQAKAENGRLLFREGKGMTPDRMAEALMEHGYLERDANDRWSLRELEEKIQDEIGGRKHYSNNADYDYLVGNGVTVENLQRRNGGRLDAAKVMGHGAEGLKVEALKMTKRDGLDPDLVAEMHGFTDGDELIRALAEAQHPKDVIEGMTDQRMLEKYGELSDPQSIERAAEAAIHNEARARFVATELKALTKATGPAKALAEAAKEAAEAAIAAKRVRDLRPAQYTAAEARASRNADKALLGQDIVAAANEKRAQLLNNRLAKAADNAIEDVRKGVDYLKKFDKAGVRENIELEYRDQIDALLDRYDLRKGTSGKALDRREALLQFVERMASEGYEPNVPEHLLDEAKRQHYKELTVEQFRGLVDAVKSIEHLGRLKTRLMDGQEAREIKLLAEEATTTMAELPQRDPESNRGLTRMESAWLSVKSAGRSAQAALLKMEQMFDWLDKRNSEGVFNRVVFRRIADAGVRENDMLGRVKAEIDKLLDTNLADVTKEKGKIYTADGLIDGLTGKAQRFTKKQMLMLAGNMGNESNVAKLIAGEKWNEQAAWDFLHANMTKADWDFVAGMGKTLETLWPEKLAMSRRLGNTNPEKIAPRPFDTPHGRYEGWYWPMMYDPARAQDVAERGAKKADALFENIYTRANTDTGRMNTRNANYAKPLLLDLDALPRVIRDEIHDIAFREAVLDADKFLSDGRVRQGIIDAMSQEHYDQLRPWLQSIANDGKLDDTGMRALKWFNDLARGARTRATMVGLGYRLSTMIVHGTSAGLESVAELGPRWFASGLRDFSNPAQWAANKDFIFERSGEMRNRMNEVDRDVREHLRQIDLELMDPTTGTVARGLDAFKAHAYQGIAMLDMASALPTWMGAYHKAMAPEAKGGLGMGEKDAIYFADKTIRNAHGGTGVKDLAAVQRGPEFFKLFTMFYTFWNHNVNRIMDTYRMGKELPATYAEGRESGDMAKFKGDLSSVLMRTLIYTFGVQIMHGMLHPPKDEDKDEAWLKWAGKEVLSAAFAGIPIARDLSAHFIQGKDYSVTPAASMVDAFDRSGKDAIDAMSGNTVSDKWLKHSITTAGYVFGLPTGQPASAVQFLWDVADAKQNPQELADWWRGILHGDMTKH